MRKWARFYGAAAILCAALAAVIVWQGAPLDAVGIICLLTVTAEAAVLGIVAMLLGTKGRDGE